MIGTAGDINPRQYDVLLVCPGSGWSLSGVCLKGISPSGGLWLPEPTVKISDVQTILLTGSVPRRCATGVVLSTVILHQLSENLFYPEA